MKIKRIRLKKYNLIQLYLLKYQTYKQAQNIKIGNIIVATSLIFIGKIFAKNKLQKILQLKSGE